MRDTRPPLLPAMQQHPFYARTIRQMGGRVAAFAPSGAQTLLRRIGPLHMAWLPRWAAPGQGALEAFLGQMGTALCIAIPDRAEDTAVFRACGFRAVLTPQHVAELALCPPEEARLAAQHGKWRNRLRHALRSAPPVSHRRFDPKRDGGLLDLELIQRRARGYSALPPGFTHAWAQANPGATRLFRIGDDTGTQAFVLVLLHAPTATYHLGWSSAKGRECAAHNLLIWQAANWLAQRGYQRLDLGIVDTQATPGLARFKIGSGAVIRPLGPTLLRLPRPRLMRRAA